MAEWRSAGVHPSDGQETNDSSSRDVLQFFLKTGVRDQVAAAAVLGTAGAHLVLDWS